MNPVYTLFLRPTLMLSFKADAEEKHVFASIKLSFSVSFFVKWKKHYFPSLND
jgi:hypothetical protein